MRKFKIAILTESLNTSSGSRAPVELAKNLSQLGNSVTIYARDKSIVKNLSGVKVVALSKPKNFLESRAIPNFELTKLLKKNPPDIALLTSFLPSLLAAKIAKIPVIKIYMGTQFDAFLENKNPDQKISNLDKLLNLIINLLIYSLEFISIRYSDFVIAISPYSGSQVRNLFRRKVDQVIYLGGDHLNLKLRASHQNSKSFNLLSVSRITPYKNFHILVSCVKELKTNANVTLTIAGKNEKSKYLKYLKKISSPNTKFTLDPSDHQLTKLYSSCDVYITADRYLFFGLPIAEAAFFSKPSIAFKKAAASELINSSQTGFTVKNQKEMIEKIKYFLNSPKSLKKMGSQAEKKARMEFSWPKIARQYQIFFEKII